MNRSQTSPVDIPPVLQAQRARGVDWAAWLDVLPRRTADLLSEWELTQVAVSRHGFASLVLPVVDADGRGAALKVAFDGDDESEHEALALQRWSGKGAVRLQRADPRRRALLMDWLPGGDLTDAWDIQACEVVGDLYARLHVPALPQLRSVSSYVTRWLDELAGLGRDVPIPRRHVDQALALGRDLLAPHDGTDVVVHGDLHYANVMADAAGTWLAIDPKPMRGDPAYEPAPMLWNRIDELESSPSQTLREGLRRRFHTLVDMAGLDESRARDWVIVRMVINAGWSVQEARRVDRGLSVVERDWITRCIAITKAVQD